MQHFVLEGALNYLISNKHIDISALAGKKIRFELENLPLEVNFVCTDNKIYVLSSPIDKTDVDIKLKEEVFLSLFKGEDVKQLLREDKIVINGDVKTAQLIVDLLEQTNIDPEEVLAKYTGDIVAHEIGKIAKKIKESAKNAQSPIDAIKDTVANFLIQPTKSDLYKNKKT